MAKKRLLKSTTAKMGVNIVRHVHISILSLECSFHNREPNLFYVSQLCSSCLHLFLVLFIWKSHLLYAAGCSSLNSCFLILRIK